MNIDIIDLPKWVSDESRDEYARLARVAANSVTQAFLQGMQAGLREVKKEAENEKACLQEAEAAHAE